MNDVTSVNPAHGRNQILDFFILAYVASVPFDILPFLAGKSVSSPVGILLIAVWCTSLLRGRKPVGLPFLVGFWLVLYLCWITASAFWSINGRGTVVQVFSILLRAILLVVISDALPRLWGRALVTLGASAALLGAFLLAQPADAARSDRANIGGIDENVTALVLSVGFAALIYLTVRRQGRHTITLLALALVTGAATLHTGSRTGAIAIVAVVVVAVLSMITSMTAPAAWFKAIGITFAIYLGYFVAVQANVAPARVLSVFGGQSQSDDDRAQIIHAYLLTFHHWFVWGVGYGQDSAYLLSTNLGYNNAHSLFWKTWIESGLIGLILFGAFLASVLKASLHSPSPAAFVLLAVPLVFFALTLGGQATAAFWLVLAFGAARRAEVPTARTRSAAPDQPTLPPRRPIQSRSR